jgi:serine/threonine protein kinase
MYQKRELSERDCYRKHKPPLPSITNICVIYEIHEDAEQPYIVMEYVDGSTIRTKLESGPFRIDDAIRYGIQIGEALHEAHSKGIVHRDIKADNIIINSKGQAKVMDFGLAKLKGSMKLTRASRTVGTLAYMAPEQIQGGEVDSRSDIFAFAVLFFEMLTGKLPFRGEHEAAMVYSIVNEDPEPIQKYVPDISGEIIHTLGKALEKNPEDRYHTIQDMVVDLRRSKKDSTRVGRLSSMNEKVSHPETVTERTEGRSGNRKIRIGLGVIAVTAIVGTLYYFFVANDLSSSLPPMKTMRLTSYPGEERDPALSPDGKSIAFSWNGQQQDNFDIYVKLVDAGVPVRLTTNALIDNRPVWSRDGRFIAFVRELVDQPGSKPREISLSPPLVGGNRELVGIIRACLNIHR